MPLLISINSIHTPWFTPAGYGLSTSSSRSCRGNFVTFASESGISTRNDSTEKVKKLISNVSSLTYIVCRDGERQRVAALGRWVVSQDLISRTICHDKGLAIRIRKARRHGRRPVHPNINFRVIHLHNSSE